MCTLGPPEIQKVGEEGKEGQGSEKGRGAGDVGLAWISPCLGLKK